MIDNVTSYLNQRIEKQRNLIRIAQGRDDKIAQKVYEYGLGMLKTIKEEVS